MASGFEVKMSSWKTKKAKLEEFEESEESEAEEDDDKSSSDDSSQVESDFVSMRIYDVSRET